MKFKRFCKKAILAESCILYSSLEYVMGPSTSRQDPHESGFRPALLITLKFLVLLICIQFSQCFRPIFITAFPYFLHLNLSFFNVHSKDLRLAAGLRIECHCFGYYLYLFVVQVSGSFSDIMKMFTCLNFLQILNIFKRQASCPTSQYYWKYL